MKSIINRLDKPCRSSGCGLIIVYIHYTFTIDPSCDFHMESTVNDTRLQSKDIPTPATLKSAARLLKPESDTAELLLPDAVADGDAEVVDEDSSCSCS